VGCLGGAVMLNDRADLGVDRRRRCGFVSQSQEVLLDIMKGPQLCINSSQLLVNHAKDVSTGTLTAVSQAEDFTNLLEGEANRLSLRNKAQAFQVCLLVEAVPRRCTIRSGKQIYLLVVTDGFRIETQLIGKFANAQLSGVRPVHDDHCTANRNRGCKGEFWFTGFFQPHQKVVIGST